MPVAGPPRTWPARYRLHKYWSRKPGDLVAGLVERHSAPGDLVLDPFCGSGVTPFEAAVLGRVAVGVDVNPVAVRIAEGTAMRCDPDRLARLGAAVVARARAEEGGWHRTRCRACGREAPLGATARRGADIVAVVVRCPRCGVRREPAEAADRRLAAASDRAGDGGAPRPPMLAGWQTRKLVRAGLADFGELFTARNHRALGAVRRAVQALDAGPERALLGLALTGALAQASRMMADHSTGGGGASWKLNIYWLPARSLELDPFRCVENRIARVVAAKKETEALLGAPGATAPRLVAGDVRRLGDVVADGTATYVFADPPYGGEGIQYGELSWLWGAWLDPPCRPPLDEEIGENPVRGRRPEDFARGLADAFACVRRALASDGRVTVTFASRDPRAWSALERALAGAGLRVLGATETPRSAPGLTQRVAAGSTRRDAWIDCVPAPRSRRLPRAVAADRAWSAAVGAAGGEALHGPADEEDHEEDEHGQDGEPGQEADGLRDQAPAHEDGHDERRGQEAALEPEGGHQATVSAQSA